MTAEWQASGATVEVLQEHDRCTDRRLMATLRRVVADRRPSAVMLWHGLVRLPQLIRALAIDGMAVGVHGGNPAHTIPRWVDWKFRLLGRVYPPAGPLPTYICCSRYVADSFETSGYLRRFPRVVVLNGVNRPSPTLYHVPRPYTPDEPFVIGMVARLDRIKDHPTLLRAFGRLKAQLPNAVLEIAGDGQEEPALRRLADELGVTPAVRFLGRVNDVYARMTGWQLFAYPTTEREGLGNAVSEAMMAGLPCVVTEVGPTREFAGADASVRLVPPADPGALAAAIVELAHDLQARTALAARGRRRAMAEFHPTVYAARYAALLGLPSPPPVSSECSDVSQN